MARYTGFLCTLIQGAAAGFFAKEVDFGAGEDGANCLIRKSWFAMFRKIPSTTIERMPRFARVFRPAA